MGGRSTGGRGTTFELLADPNAHRVDRSGRECASAPTTNVSIFGRGSVCRADSEEGKEGRGADLESVVVPHGFRQPSHPRLVQGKAAKVNMTLVGIVEFKIFARLVKGPNTLELRDLSTHGRLRAPENKPVASLLVQRSGVCQSGAGRRGHKGRVSCGGSTQMQRDFISSKGLRGQGGDGGECWEGKKSGSCVGMGVDARGEAPIGRGRE
jgi:hypothetical protein